jgi:hypothetical protein
LRDITEEMVMNGRWLQSMIPLCGVLVAGVPAVVSAQAYPAKPVRLIVPFAAGGGSDVVARMIGAELAKAWGQPIVVENRAGAGGIIGAEHVLRSPPDGYTMLLVEIGGLSIRSTLYKLPFDLLKDFTGVAVVAYGPNVLVTHPSVPARSVRDLIALRQGVLHSVQGWRPCNHRPHWRPGRFFGERPAGDAAPDQERQVACPRGGDERAASGIAWRADPVGDRSRP